MSRVTVDGEVVREFVTVGVQGAEGAQGPQGAAATVDVGSVATLAPGDAATVVNAGTVNDAVLNFGIPQGEKGDKGDPGEVQGPGSSAVGNLASWGDAVGETLADSGVAVGAIAAAQGDASQALLDAATADGKAVAAQGDIDAHVADTANPHSTTAAQVGADPSGTAASVVSAHNAESTSVHGIADTSDLIVEGDARLSDARVPTSHASTHAVGGSDEVSPASIGAASVAEVQAAQSTADAAIPASEKGAADGVATLDAGGTIATAQVAPAFALGARNSAFLIWDDFRTDSADLNGRVSPHGATWSVVDANGVMAPGEISVADGRAIKQGDGSLAVIGVPVADARGLLVKALISARNTVRTRVVVFDSGGDSVFFDFRGDTAGRGFRKSISGVTSDLSTPNTYPLSVNSGQNNPLDLTWSIVNSGTANKWIFGVSYLGESLWYEWTDAEARAVLDDAAFVGVSLFTQSGNSNIASVYHMSIMRTEA